MRMLQSILLPTNLRPASDDVVKTAIRLASPFGSQVTLLHVVETPPSIPPAMILREELHADAALRSIAEELAARKVTVAASSVATGSPADAIVRKAQEIDADLILMCAWESNQTDRLSVGPTATVVLEHAPQPVLLVRPGEPLPRFRKILCPVDQSGASARGLQNAVRLAGVFGREVVALTVVPKVSWLSAAAETGQLADAMTEHEIKWRSEFETFLETIDLENVKVTREVRFGVPHQQIVAAAQDHQPDVIIMGATGRTGLLRVLLGSTTRHVLQQLPSSLLVVKEQDVVEELFEEDIRTMDLLMEEARGLMDSKSYLAATVRFRQVLGCNPFHVAAVEGLAEAHKRLGHHREADYYHRRAEKLRHASYV